METASSPHEPPHKASRLARDSAIVGFATVLSRLLGFVRDILVARALGAGPFADAFLVAFRLPNMFRRVLGEGGLNAPFIPVYMGLKAEEGEASARRFGGEAIGNFAAILLIIVGLSELIAPWLVLGLAGGFRDAPLTFALAENYTRLALPFVGFTVLASLVAAILNADKRFAVAALGPIMLNIVLISSLLWNGYHDQPVFRIAKNLAWSVSLAGALHLLLLFWALGWKAPGIPRFSLGWSQPMRRLLKLGVPALLASATSQIVLLVATQIASSQPGAVSWLYYADRIFQLPLGFVAVAMGVVLLPEIAAREAAEDDAGRRATVDGALSLGLILAIPAAVALALLAEPIVSVLFERGRFGAVDREQTAAALAAFAIGLPGAVIAKVLSQIYFARQNPGKPLLAGLASIGVAIVSGIALGGTMPATGAALAASLAFWTQGLLLTLLVLRDRLWSPGGALLRQVLAALVAAAAMGAALLFLGVEIRLALVAGQAGLREFALLAALCAAGLALYGVAAFALGAFRGGFGAEAGRHSARLADRAGRARAGEN